MEKGDDVSAAILEVLKFSPRGLSITDISKKLKKDRNSIARQLDVFRAEGKVETRQIGTARVYWLSQRVPLSAFLCFTRNMILILDRNLNIVQANDRYTGLTGHSKDELIGKNIHEVKLPVVSDPEILGIIESAGKEQVIADVRTHIGKDEFFYKMEVIPTSFEAGETGLTIVLEDITEKKRHLKNMEFLARTAMELVDLPPEADIYQYIADKVIELVPGVQGFVDAYDQGKRHFFMKAIFNRTFREGLKQLTGQDIVGMTFRINDLIDAPHQNSVSNVFMMAEHNFRPKARSKGWSFYDLCFRQIPAEICDEILTRFDIGKLIGISIIWNGQLFGVVGIFLPSDRELENRQAVESFIRQSSIALARRMTEERFMRSEQRFRDLIASSDQPSVVIGRDERKTLVNPRFSEEFGYIQEDIPTRDAWLEKAFPDPIYRKEIVSVLNSDHNPSNRTFTIRCRDGREKGVIFRPVHLSDGTVVVECEVKVELT